MRSSWFAGACALAFVMVSASCSSFTEEDAPPVEDGGADGVAPDASPIDGGGDGPIPLDGGGMNLRLPCPPPRAGNTVATGWKRRKLYVPPGPAGRMYPFAIATDAQYVTWVAQLGTPDGGADTAPYNGIGTAVVMRASKLGTGTVKVIARDQPSAVTVALDGPDVYWVTETQNVATLRSQPRDADCDVSCPEPRGVTAFPSGVRIARLVRPAPGVLFALAQDGRLFRVDLAGAAPVVVATSGTYPAMAATSSDVFTSAGLSPKVQRSPVDGKTAAEDAYITFPADPDPEIGVGVSPIATDCTTLWMARKTSQGHRIHGREIAGAPSLSLLTTLPPGLAIFDLAADARYIYVAAANAGGVFAIDKVSMVTSTQYTGNVWAVAVDDDGVYFGEHAEGAIPGSMFMLVRD